MPTPGEECLALLIDRSNHLHPGEIAGAVAESLQLVGITDASVLVSDLAQEVLVPLGMPGVASVEIDGSLAGRAFRTSERVVIDEERRAWFPIIDGSDRLGVLAVALPPHDEHLLKTCQRVAALTGELLVSRSQYGDTIHVARRVEPLTLAAELRWALLPPLTFETHQVHIAAVLEPSYSVAGDTFDYAVDSDTAHFAVFDAMGHGLEASRIANLVTGAYRYERRRGSDLVATYEGISGAVATQFDASRFATGVLARLALGTGELRLMLAGHPAPLLLRNHRVVDQLTCRPTTPFGISDPDPLVATFQLEPGDRVILYSDGVVEAKRADGDDFGLDRLSDFLERAESAGEPPAETMRRLAKAILVHQERQLQDDATLLMVHWRP